MHIVSLSGSPSASSRSSWLLQLAAQRLGQRVRSNDTLVLRDLPARELLTAQAGHPLIAEAVARVRDADTVLVATPIYKAAYSGLLKLFLDLLPQDALRGKAVLPLATGGSPGHLLALDYALKPVLGALGARHIADAVYAVDTQIQAHPIHGYVADDELLGRLDRALQGLGQGPEKRRPVLPRHDAPVLVAQLPG